MGTIKDINGRDLVDMKRSRTDGKNTQKNCIKKIQMSQMTMMVGHTEPNILECKVKWALGSTAVNKATECDGIPVELFKTLKDESIKVLHSMCQQIWKT